VCTSPPGRKQTFAKSFWRRDKVVEVRTRVLRSAKIVLARNWKTLREEMTKKLHEFRIRVAGGQTILVVLRLIEIPPVGNQVGLEPCFYVPTLVAGIAQDFDRRVLLAGNHTLAASGSNKFLPFLVRNMEQENCRRDGAALDHKAVGS